MKSCKMDTKLPSSIKLLFGGPTGVLGTKGLNPQNFTNTLVTPLPIDPKRWFNSHTTKQ